MALKIFSLLIGGTLISGGVATAVVISQRNTENSELERSDTSSPNTKGQKTQDDKHQETIPSVQEKQKPSQVVTDGQKSQPETHTQGSEVGSSFRSLDLEQNQTSGVDSSHPKNLGDSTVEREVHP